MPWKAKDYLTSMNIMLWDPDPTYRLWCVFVCFAWPGSRADSGSRGATVLPPGLHLGLRPGERPSPASLLGAFPPQRAGAYAASLPPSDHDDQGEGGVYMMYIRADLIGPVYRQLAEKTPVYRFMDFFASDGY